MIQLSTAVRNARLDAIETTIAASAVLRIRSGAAPANCASADTGTVLAALPLPADYLAAASGGVKAMAGSWTDAAADATGIGAHFRLYSSGGTCHMQGTVSAPGGGGDLIVDNVSFAAGQPFAIVEWALTDGNA